MSSSNSNIFECFDYFLLLVLETLLLFIVILFDSIRFILLINTEAPHMTLRELHSISSSSHFPNQKGHLQG